MFEKVKQNLLGNKKNKKILITVAWVSAVLILLIFAAATGGSQTPQPTDTAEFNIGEMIFGTVVRLILVLALIYGIFSIYQLFQKNGQGIREKRIRMIDIHRFSAKQSILLMKIDNQELLIGLTDHKITLLKDMGTPQDSNDMMQENEESADKPFHQFMDEQNEQ